MTSKKDAFHGASGVTAVALLFIVPAGLLAVIGVDALRGVAPRRLALAALIVLAVPGLVALAEPEILLDGFESGTLLFWDLDVP